MSHAIWAFRQTANCTAVQCLSTNPSSTCEPTQSLCGIKSTRPTLSISQHCAWLWLARLYLLDRALISEAACMLVSAWCVWVGQLPVIDVRLVQLGMAASTEHDILTADCDRGNPCPSN
jgi:hypothetical protein